MSKYHVTINADHWERNHPGFLGLSAKERTAIIRREVDFIQGFLEGEVPQGSVSLLVSDETVIIDPLHGDIDVKKLE